jgi:2-desacetyl-2-hydroxyethyl bacteriochlorophyllide A dehydrogenase
VKSLSLVAPRQFEFIDRPEPGPPGPREALVAVHRVGVCGTDVAAYLGKMPFIDYPRVLGHELGVEVLAAGDDAGVRVGDRCAVEPYLSCGDCPPCRRGFTNCCESLRVLGVHCDGGLCLRLRLPAARLHRSASLSFEQLALVETLGIGRHAVARGSVSAGDSVLVIGAGPIGLSVLEFARLAGAHCTVVEPNESRHRFVARLPDVDVAAKLPDTFRAGIVFDATGSADSMAGALRFAHFAGRVVFVGITKDPVPLDDTLFHRRELTLFASRNARADDFSQIIALIEAGKINTSPWITHRVSFDDVPQIYPDWLHTDSGVVKAMVAVSDG